MSRLAKLQFALYHVEDFWLDNGFMIAFDVVLLDFSIVATLFLRQEIYGVGLLQQCIAFVLFIAENTADGSCRPFGFVARRRDRFFREQLCDPMSGHALKEKAEYVLHDLGFFLVDDHLSIFSLVIT